MTKPLRIFAAVAVAVAIEIARADFDVDDWGRDIRVLCDPASVTITAVSAGFDGLFGTPDDVF